MTNGIELMCFSIAYGNENLGWEKKYTTNLGLDFDLFNGAIQFSGDFYFQIKQ